MKFELSPALETALKLAGGLAQEAGAAAIQPGHLLRGLLAEEEGQSWQQLRQAGLSPSLWQGVKVSIPEHDWPSSAAVRQILADARELAALHGTEGTVATDHVLFTLLSQEQELRGQLEQGGLDFTQFSSRFETQALPLRLDEPLELSEPRAAFDAARLLDANANRAREALRVVEDYCRFVRNDAFLAGEWKRLRHDLAQALNELPYADLLHARDTLHDVGTTLSTPQEQERDSLAHVAQANAKRLQEALRALEEVGKTMSPALGQALEALRYRSYTLERAMLLGEDSRRRLAGATLYVLVTEAHCRHSLEGTVREALAGGAHVIQLREKSLADRDLLAKARSVRRLTRAAGALFIMNDRADLALSSEADGVHLGQDDLPVQEARRLLGAEAIIGVSTHDMNQVRQALLDGADYIGVGPTFPSTTKTFHHFPGLPFVKETAAATSLPAFILGGVTLANIDQVRQAGGRRVAVSQAVCAADDPRHAAAALRQQLERA